MIMSAGLGMRLRPFTSDTPKALMPVMGVPVIQFALDTLKNSGIKKSFINYHHLPKKSVYGESLRRHRGAEWRRWDPFRSKLGAGIVRAKKERDSLLPQPGTTVLYLGAAHGTTVSHLHDHLCGKENIFL